MSTNRRGANERPLRVLQVTSTAVGGDWFHDQVTGLARLGHDVCAVVPGEGPLTARLRAAGVRTEIVPMSGWRPQQLPRVAAAQLRLIRLIRRFRPDVVHGHLVKANIVCRLATLVVRRPLLVNQIAGVVHLRSPLFKRIDRATLPRVDVLIGSCHAFADQYRRLGARAVTVSHYGCDVHRLDPTVSGQPFRAEFGLTADTPTVGMLAHMYRSRLQAFQDIGFKGHEVFIDAAPRLLSRVPAAHLFVVGDDFTGDVGYRRDLEERAARLGVADRVHFTGRRSDVQGVLAGLDVAVTPSLEESASYATVEALLMERGVVASDVGGLPDTVQHGESGLLVPPADPEALADAVIDLLESPQQRAAMGRLGRDRCLHLFDIERTVADVEAIYRAALDGRPLPRAGRLPEVAQ
ncbi:glycosyltransferase family 4 protein [Micromonospora sp. NPDC047467]|uniref:glycosyltransferase family 4 protein n=1 Tax=Micromonospora sp. NPDC047467 TaxID=3154814 RepID=UPI0033C2B248